MIGAPSDVALHRKEQQAQLRKFIRHVPLDEEGYTQAFTVDQEADCAAPHLSP